MSISLHDECLQLDQQVSVFLKSLRNFDSSDNELNSVDEESSSEPSPIIRRNKKNKKSKRIESSDSEDFDDESNSEDFDDESDSEDFDDESNKNYVSKHGMNSGSIKLNNNGSIVKLPCGRHSGLAKTGTKQKKTKKQKDDDNTLFYKKINKNIKGKKYALLLSSKPLDETKLSKYGFKIIESLKLIENINTPNSVNNSKEWLTLLSVKDENKNIYKEKFSVFKKSINLNKEPNTLRNKPEIIEQILNKKLATEEITPNMSSIFNIFKNTYEKKKNINEETTFYCPIGVSEKFASTNNRNPENKLATSTITGLYYKGRKYKLNSEANFVLRDIYFDLNLNKTKSNNHIRHCVHPFYIQKLTEAFN